jgi:hypothetical protein
VGDLVMSAAYAVRIFGPNLTAAGQAKGGFHVHREGCGDRKHYGPGTRYGGEDQDGWLVEVDTAREAVEAVYADQLDEGDDYDSCAADLWFAPCLKELP